MCFFGDPTSQDNNAGTGLLTSFFSFRRRCAALAQRDNKGCIVVCSSEYWWDNGIDLIFQALRLDYYTV